MLNRETEESVDRLRQVSPDAQPMWWFDCDTCRDRRSIPSSSIRTAWRWAVEAGWLVDEDGLPRLPLRMPAAAPSGRVLTAFHVSVLESFLSVWFDDWFWNDDFATASFGQGVHSR